MYLNVKKKIVNYNKIKVHTADYYKESYSSGLNDLDLVIYTSGDVFFLLENKNRRM